MKTAIISLAIVLLLALGYWWSVNNTGNSSSKENTKSGADKQAIVNKVVEGDDPLGAGTGPDVPDETVATETVDFVPPEPGANNAAGTQPVGSETRTVDENGNPLIGGDAVAPEPTPGDISFSILGGNYYYDIKTIKVKEGDRVTVNFRSVDGTHDWVVDEFNAATKQVQTDGSSTVTFIADKKGTFEYYCSVGSHRANGMVGKLVVE